MYSDFVTNSYGESYSPKLNCLGLYVTRQLIWRQMPKLFITVYWKKKSHKPHILSKKSSNWEFLGDLYASGTQDAETTKSLHVQMYMLFCSSSSPDSNDICMRLTSVQQKTIRKNMDCFTVYSIGKSLTNFLALLEIDR